VLTEPGLSTIVHGILIARCIFVRIRNFITYRIAATLQLLIFFFIAVFAFKPSDYQPADNPDSEDWPSYFHMPVLLLMLITLLNDGTLISIGYDNVIPQQTPETWNLRVLFMIGSVMAAVACLSSLLLLYMLLDSWAANGVFGILNIPGLSYGQITTSIYLKVSVSDFLTLFSARTGDDWFWTSRPAPILMYAACFALSCSTIVACSLPSSYPDGVYTLGLERRAPYFLPVYIWLYCIGWWFIQDAAKIGIIKWMKAYNIFGINDTGMVVLDDANSEKARLLNGGLSSHHV
jgi:H+-transporting ATPase